MFFQMSESTLRDRSPPNDNKLLLRSARQCWRISLAIACTHDNVYLQVHSSSVCSRSALLLCRVNMYYYTWIRCGILPVALLYFACDINSTTTHMIVISLERIYWLEKQLQHIPSYISKLFLALHQQPKYTAPHFTIMFWSGRHTLSKAHNKKSVTSCPCKLMLYSWCKTISLTCTPRASPMYATQTTYSASSLWTN